MLARSGRPRRYFTARYGRDTITRDIDSTDYSTRRGFFLAGGTAVAGLLAGGASAVLSLQGDDGDYTAEDGFPAVSTRGYFDGDGEQADGVDGTMPQRQGDWSGVDADAVVLYVHGLNATEGDALDQAATLRRALADTAASLPVVSYTWDSDREWAPAKRTADANGRALARWLARFAAEDGRPVHVVGHSLGARVICAGLRDVTRANRATSIATTSVLGGAIPTGSVLTDAAYGPAIASATPAFYNFHSQSDQVLGLLYRASDGTNAVGHGGSLDPAATPANYTDVDVTDAVADHYSYYEPGEGCVPRLADSLT